MTNSDGTARRWRRLAIGTWALLGLLLLFGLAAMFVLAATDDTDNIALSQNAVVGAPNGKRVWQGTFWNHSDSLYEKLDAIVLFVDRDGAPVGQVRGGAARLEPGEVFHLSAPLPPSAAAMRVYRLRWSREGGPLADLGPYRVWPFGYVMDRQCGETRLALGSCSEQRERQ